MRFLSFLRPRYSLRALLVVMTLFALFFGIHWNWIQQRRALLAGDRIKPFESWQAAEKPPAPSLLWLFGESGEFGLTIDNKDGSVDIERVQVLFPESGLVVSNTNDQPPQVIKPKIER